MNVSSMREHTLLSPIFPNVNRKTGFKVKRVPKILRKEGVFNVFDSGPDSVMSFIA